MNERTLETAASPQDFILALQRNADRCRNDAAELGITWQDGTAGVFWKDAAIALERAADRLATQARKLNLID